MRKVVDFGQIHQTMVVLFQEDGDLKANIANVHNSSTSAAEVFALNYGAPISVTLAKVWITEAKGKDASVNAHTLISGYLQSDLPNTDSVDALNAKYLIIER